MKMKRVYFFKPVGFDGPIKIGCSDTPFERLTLFAGWSPHPLEMIGFVPGTYADEQFLHECFADSHAHREWFQSSPALRDAIQTILNAGTVDAVRGSLKPVASIRARISRRSSPAMKECTSFKMKVMWTEKRIRKADEKGRWHAPYDITAIIDSWTKRVSIGGDQTPASAAEIARIREYLAAPELHSVHPSWHVISNPEVAA